MVMEKEEGGGSEEEASSSSSSAATVSTSSEEKEDIVPNIAVISNFLSACGSLDLKKIREVIETEKVHPNALEDELGQNGFHYAICSTVRNSSRQSTVLKYLLKKGLNINKARTSDGWTPIFLAVTFGLHSIVSWLLSKGAKINVQDSESHTPEDIATNYRMHKIKDTLIHHRSRVPHSRFSCVLSGPALSSPPSTETTSASSQEISSDTSILSSPTAEGDTSENNTMLKA